MNALLVYPKCPDTFWSFKYALKFIAKRAAYPPLGLLTVASMLPGEWDVRLVDMNVASLRRRDLRWADIVFISAMTVQRKSARAVIERCKQAGARIVVGGPLFTAEPEDYEDVDHLVLDEAESTLPAFLEDLECGCPKKLYRSGDYLPLDNTPRPMWSLLDRKRYASMNLQYSRGCPFDCEFCDISFLYGRKVRTKSAEQVVAELDDLYRWGFRGEVFFVDDNFIGNRKKLREKILPAITEWMNKRGHPFSFITETSIDLANDAGLMRQMVEAGFASVFVGIESPNDESLAECGKRQNRKRDLGESVELIQKTGLQVTAGFIVGFDSDPPNIFEQLSNFIQKTGIITAMVGLLNAPRGTRLYRRLSAEGRLLEPATGDNTDCTTNILPKMGLERLIEGYKDVIKRIYSRRPYYRRVRRFLRSYNPPPGISTPFKPGYIKAFLRSVLRIGIVSRDRWQYWKLLFWTLFRRPKLFPMAVSYSIFGLHFRMVFQRFL